MPEGVPLGPRGGVPPAPPTPPNLKKICQKWHSAKENSEKVLTLWRDSGNPPPGVGRGHRFARRRAGRGLGTFYRAKPTHLFILKANAQPSGTYGKPDGVPMCYICEYITIMLHYITIIIYISII